MEQFPFSVRFVRVGRRLFWARRDAVAVDDPGLAHACDDATEDARRQFQDTAAVESGATVAALRRFLPWPWRAPESGAHRMRRLMLAALVVAGCSPVVEEENALRVAVSILPQQEIVHRVAGDDVDVQVLVPPGASPATFNLSPRELGSLVDADVLFTVGVPFDRALVTRLASAAPDLEAVDMGRDVPREAMEGHAHGDLEHDNDHSAEARDPHIWLDPRRVATMAETVRTTLCRLRPDRCELFATNAAAYAAELDRTEDRLEELMSPCRGRAVAVFHPSYGYLLRPHGVAQVAIEIEGKDPTPRQLSALQGRLVDDNVPVILVQPQFGSRAAEAAASGLGVPVLNLDPLAPDLSANLERMAAAVGDACRQRETIDE